MDDNKAPHEFRVDADSLEHTRQGLRTRSPLPVQVGRHNRVMLNADGYLPVYDRLDIIVRDQPDHGARLQLRYCEPDPR